jgi:hypothetical protein
MVRTTPKHIGGMSYIYCYINIYVNLVVTFEERRTVLFESREVSAEHVDISCMADTIIKMCVNDCFVSTYKGFL